MPNVSRLLTAIVACSVVLIAGCSPSGHSASGSRPPFKAATGTVTVDTCNDQTTQYLGYTLCERPPICVSDSRTDCVRWNDLLSFLILIRPPQAFDTPGIVPNKVAPRTRFSYQVKTGLPPHDVPTFSVSGGGIRPNAEIADPIPVECSVGDFGGPTCEETVVVYPPACDLQCADECALCQDDPIDYPDPNRGGDGWGGQGGNQGGEDGGSTTPLPTPPIGSDGGTTSAPITTQGAPPTDSGPSSSASTAAFCEQLSADLVLACNNRKEATCLLAQVAGSKGGTMAGAVSAAICKMYYNTICQQWKDDPCGKSSFTVWFGYRPRGASGPVIGFGDEP